MHFKTKKTCIMLFSFLAIAVGAALTVWRTVLLKKYYDPYHESFENGSGVILEIFEYVLVFAMLIFLFSLLFTRGVEFPSFNHSSTLAIFVKVLCGFICMSVVMISVFGTRKELFASETKDGVSLVYIIAMILAIISLFFVSLYFFVSSSVKFLSSPIKIYLSFSLPIFALLYLIASYFNKNFMYNDFNRITCHVSFIAIILFALSKVRLEIGRKSYAFHFVTSLLCIVSISSYIIPLVLLSAFWEINFSATTAFESVEIGLLIYAVYSAFYSASHLSEN